MEKFQDKLLKFSLFFANNKILQIISSAFMMIMPITMIGGFVSLFKGLDFGGYQAFIINNGIYDALGKAYIFTVGFLSIWVVFAIGYQFCMKNNMHADAITVGLASIVAFFIITPYTAPQSVYGAAGLTTDWTGATGMFTAMITGFIVGALFKACKTYHLEIKLPEQVPPNIAKQISAIIPMAIVVIVFMIINKVFEGTAMGSAQQFVYTVVKTPLSAVGSNIIGAWILIVFCYLMWFFGIHGGLTVMPMMMLLFTSLQYENLAAYQAGAELPNMVTGSYLSVGSGSITMIVAMLIFAKAESNKALTKLAILPAFFGVDEPAYFGFPMIMNPIFFVPWVILVPTVTVFGTYLLQKLGLLGYYTGVSAGSFVPFFMSNMVGYGVRGLLWGFVFFVIAVLIYVPFVKAYDAQQLKAEAEQAAEENK